MQGGEARWPNRQRLMAGTLPEAKQSSLLAEASAPQRDAASGSLARVSPHVFVATSSTATSTCPTASQSAVDRLRVAQIAPRRQRPAWQQRVEPYLPWIVCLWALGVAVFSLRLLAGWNDGPRPARRRRRDRQASGSGGLHRLKTRLGILVSRAARVLDVGEGADGDRLAQARGARAGGIGHGTDEPPSSRPFSRTS